MQPDGSRYNSAGFRPENYLGWAIVTLLCAVPVVFWLQLHSLSSVSSWSKAVFELGKLAGMIGLVLYSINLVLTTRLKVLESIFGGLNKVYIAHHIIGGLALAFLAFHPLLLALRFIGTSAYESFLLLLPNGLGPISALFDRSSLHHPTVLHQWAIFDGIIAFWGLVVLLFITFFVKLPYKVWLFIHKFLGVSFFFAGVHVLFIGSDLARSSALKFYLLSLVVLGLTAFVYKTLAGNILIRKYDYTVDSVRTVGGNVSELYLKPRSSRLQHLPGQFVFVRFPASGKVGVKKEWHPFSISSSPAHPRLRLDIKAVGDYTSSLSKLRPGEKAEVEGAYGKFSYTKFKNNNQIWIAGGIGVTPFLSMAQSLPTGKYNIDMFYCVSTTSELVDWPALTKTSKSILNFHLHTFVKSKNQRYLSAKAINKVTALEGKEIFICGPPAMMSSLRTQLQALGVHRKYIHTEEFSMS